MTNKTRIAAKQAGDRFYYPDRPCKYHHPAQRYTTNGQCVMCQKSVNRGIGAEQRATAPDDAMIGLRPVTLMIHPDDLANITDQVDALKLARHIDRAVGVQAMIGQVRAAVIG